VPAALPALIIALRAFLAIFGAWLMRLAWGVTLGLLLRGLANEAGHVPLIGGRLRGWVLAADNAVNDAIGQYAYANERLLAEFFDASATLTDWVGDAIAFQAAATYHAFDALIHGHLPQAIRARSKPLSDTVDAVARRERADSRAAAKGIDDLGARSRAFERAQEARFRAGIDRIEARLRDNVMPRLDAVERTASAERARVSRRFKADEGSLARLWKAVFGGVVAATALGVLTRYFPYWRCANVRRFNRNLCRSPVGATDALFALLAFQLVAVDPKEVVRESQRIAEALEGILRKTIDL
jgi:hypothetical protein